MIEEIYVSFEIAKLLKEKGFNVFGDGSYGTETEIHREYSPFGKIRDCSTSKPSQKGYPAPTQQMAMKWLRDVHDIFIKLEFDADEDIQWHPSLALIKANKYIHTNELQWYDTYEQACETAIKYCLENLI